MTQVWHQCSSIVVEKVGFFLSLQIKECLQATFLELICKAPNALDPVT